MSAGRTGRTGSADDFRLEAPEAPARSMQLSFSLPLIAEARGLRMQVWESAAEQDRSGTGRACLDRAGGATAAGAAGGAAEGCEALDAQSGAIGGRWARLLRELYPRDAEKRIARDFEVSPRTAKGWLAGRAPYAKYLSRAAERFGAELIVQVVAPGARWSPERIRVALRELDERLAKLQEHVVVLRDGHL